MIKLIFLVLVNIYNREIGTPPYPVPMGSAEGDIKAPGGKPCFLNRYMSTVVLTLASGYYWNLYSNEPLTLFDLLSFGLATSGFLLRQWTCNLLKEFFTFDIGIRKDHKLITTGPYQYLIHPSYTGQLLCFLGTLLFLQVPLTYFALLFSYCVYMAYKRAIIEENFLLANLPEYPEYTSRRWRFIPWTY